MEYMEIVRMDALIYAWASIGTVISFLIVYPICLKLKDNSLVDLGWALAFIVQTWIAYLVNGFTNNSWSTRQIIITCLVTVWGIRLITYIIIRKIIRGPNEDKRFSHYREEWKKNFALKTFGIIFVPQMFLVYIIGFPALFANTIIETTGMLTTLDYVLMAIGGLIWLIGFFFETVSDIQLMIFRNNPENKGKTLRRGLWRYSRHPNYFGEATQWWGIFLLAISIVFRKGISTTTIVLGVLSVLGPIILTFLLLKVSGVGLLEETVLKDKEGYEDYIKTTSAFIPWFPKKK
jgi:steroid 5-alpha reductase family enzyme